MDGLAGGARRDDPGPCDELGFPRAEVFRECGIEEIESRQKKADRRRDGGKKFEITGWMAGLNMAFSIAFFIFMYKYLPLLATTELKKVDPVFAGQFLFNLVDGLIRIAMFLLFVWGVSLWKDIRRVYEYHGAEHKTVFAFENGDPLDTSAVQKYSTYHPRCGTSFLMTVMIISMLVYMAIPVQTFWARFGIRVALLPVIAGYRTKSYRCGQASRFAVSRHVLREAQLKRHTHDRSRATNRRSRRRLWSLSRR